MPSGIKTWRLARLQIEPSITALTISKDNTAEAQVPDDILSAAFRHAVGGKPGDGRLGNRSLQIARQAKSERPGGGHSGVAPQRRPGPRSGHK